MITIWYFLIHVLAFWGVWKVADAVFHRIIPPACLQCKRKDEEFDLVCEELNALREMMGKTDKVKPRTEVKKETLELHEKFANANRKVNDLLERVRRLRALHQINSARAEEIDDIYGVGKVIAGRIVQMRPFNSLEDVDRLIPGFNISSILRWSDRRWQQKRQPPI